MSHSIAIRLFLVAAIVLSFTITVIAAPAPPGRQLVLISADQPASLPALADIGAPLYARFHASDRPYLLAGATVQEAAVLAASGADVRVLDPDVSDQTYYLVYPAPGVGLPTTLPDGSVLYRDERVLVIRSEQAAMERLAATGAEIVRVTLDAKPLQSEAVAAFPLVTAPDPVVRWMADQVQQATLEQYVGDLTGATPATIRGSSYTIMTRNTNSGTPIQKATYYVGDHLHALGLTVEEHRWGAATAPNVIGQKTGATRPGDIFMLTAHLDDMPTGATAPGADDNASGSAAVLAAADILAQFGWDCTLRFALWTGEEQGLLGSAKYAQRAKGNGEKILGVFNLDMIAWNTPGSPRDVDLHADSLRPATVELANQAASVMDAYDIALIPEVRADGTGASDHASFWTQGYTAILGIEDYYPGNHDFDPYYHKTTDTLATLDLGYYTEYVKAAVAETAHMAGCLTTGGLQGQLTASHDNSPIVNAEISLTDAAGRAYTLAADAFGQYSQAIPPGTYSATVTAYGYTAATASNIAVTANGSTALDFTLSAAAPSAPTASAALDAGEVELAWPHLSPNTAYEVHRSTAPYFIPETATRIATLDAAHPPAAQETLDWRDAASGSGEPAVNHYYVTLGLNAAGQSAASGATGEFDFALTTADRH